MFNSGNTEPPRRNVTSPPDGLYLSPYLRVSPCLSPWEGSRGITDTSTCLPPLAGVFGCGCTIFFKFIIVVTQQMLVTVFKRTLQEVLSMRGRCQYVAPPPLKGQTSQGKDIDRYMKIDIDRYMNVKVYDDRD